MGRGRGRGRRGLPNIGPDNVHAVRRQYMTLFVQMEEAERQFTREQVAEDTEMTH